MKLAKLLTAFFFTSAMVLPAVELPLVNGGFEDGIRGWDTDDFGMTLFLADAAHSGTAGVRMTDDDVKRAAELCSARVKTTPGVHAVEFWARSRDHNSQVEVTLLCFGENGKKLLSDMDEKRLSRKLDTGPTWKLCRFYAEAPPGTVEMAFRMASKKPWKCQVELDDVKIRTVAQVGKETGVVELKSRGRHKMEDKMLNLDYNEIAERMTLVEASVHPRLFASSELFEQLKHEIEEKDGIRRRFANRLRFLADSLLDVPELERIQTGRRLLAISRLALYRISTLALSYRLYGNPAHRDKAIREMRAVSSFSDWNPSHFLDVAEMTLGMSIGYDWLYNELSDEDRELIANAIMEKGLKAINPKDSWYGGIYNWTQVCWTGMLSGALAVAERDTETCRHIVHEGVRRLAIPMSVYAPAGAYPEGVAYWHYGTGFNVIGLSLLTQAFGTTFGLAELPGFRETGNYNDYIIGPSGFIYNYADCQPGRRSTFGGPWWFAQYFDDPGIVSTAERKAFEEYLAEVPIVTNSKDAKQLTAKVAEKRVKIKPEVDNGWYRALAMFWIFDEEANTSMTNLPLVWSMNGEVPLAIMRTSWDDASAVFVGAKGTSPIAGHRHLDAGSFVLDAHQKRWLVDLGLEPYHPIEVLGLNLWSNAQDSDRWKLFRYSNFSHNTLTIDNHLQNSVCNAPLTSVLSNETGSKATIDLTDAYKGDCTSAFRTISLAKDGTVVVIDELEGLKPDADVRWGAITDKKAGRCDGKTLTLTDGADSVTLTADDGNWSIVDVEHPQPPFKGDSPNPGKTRIEFHRAAPANGKLTITVTITP